METSLKTVSNIEAAINAPADKWAGALENYTLTENNGSILLEVDMDINNEYRYYFDTAWPEAMEKLKEIFERKSQ